MESNPGRSKDAHVTELPNLPKTSGTLLRFSVGLPENCTKHRKTIIVNQIQLQRVKIVKYHIMITNPQSWKSYLT